MTTMSNASIESFDFKEALEKHKYSVPMHFWCAMLNNFSVMLAFSLTNRYANCHEFWEPIDARIRQEVLHTEVV